VNRKVTCWMTRALSLIGAVGLTLSLVSAGSAEAATSGSLKVCSAGGYSSLGEFPSRGGLETFVVFAGKCQTFDLKLKNGERVVVQGDPKKRGNFISLGFFSYDKVTRHGFRTTKRGFVII
jgi:hypothetical protein